VSPQELDNKLLGFGALVPGKATLIDSTAQFVTPSMTAELYGMFFVAEDVFGADNNPNRPLELTCYRRNLWQCSGQITLPRHVSHYVDEQGRQAPAIELAASITAIESIDGKPTEIISIPWKSSNPAIGESESTKSAGAPPPIALDLSASQELDDGSNQVTIPVAWKRLQFKHATANNGRRKGLQQHYVVQINLLVKTKSGEYIKISEIQSGPVIVRGRSPRNFDSRKDVPLTGGAASDKRVLAEKRSMEGLSGGGSGPSTGPIPRYNHQQQPPDWSSSTPRPFSHHPQTPQHPNKKLAVSNSSLNNARPPVPSWGDAFAANPSLSPNPMSKSRPMPIALSLSEEEQQQQRSPPNRSGSSGAESPTAIAKSGFGGKGKEAAGGLRLGSGQQISTGNHRYSLSQQSNGGGGGSGSSIDSTNNPLASPLETADMLYEYFPLSLDDW